jgi:hypothetical protein
MDKDNEHKSSVIETEDSFADLIFKALKNLISQMPSTTETAVVAPSSRSRAIVGKAAIKAAGVAGTLALPPGPMGLVTIIPDLIAIWKIQNQMVVDISAVFGKKATLTQEQMLFCLFKHSVGQVVRDIVVRAGQRVVVKEISARVTQKVLKDIGIKLAHRTTAKAIARWMPIVGAVGIGAYAYYDTAQVGKNCMELFSKDITTGF